ncbi:pseudouridine synthase [Massilia sp. W12]|uniref:pseudouridine synthase n=1 Tax=Massilia sp. W12 TaxID=3126507 RepID=UPI0030D3CFCE
MQTPRFKRAPAPMPTQDARSGGARNHTRRPHDDEAGGKAFKKPFKKPYADQDGGPRKPYPQQAVSASTTASGATPGYTWTPGVRPKADAARPEGGFKPRSERKDEAFDAERGERREDGFKPRLKSEEGSQEGRRFARKGEGYAVERAERSDRGERAERDFKPRFKRDEGGSEGRRFERKGEGYGGARAERGERSENREGGFRPRAEREGGNQDGRRFERKGEGFGGERRDWSERGARPERGERGENREGGFRPRAEREGGNQDGRRFERKGEGFGGERRDWSERGARPERGERNENREGGFRPRAEREGGNQDGRRFERKGEGFGGERRDWSERGARPERGERNENREGGFRPRAEREGGNQDGRRFERKGEGFGGERRDWSERGARPERGERSENREGGFRPRAERDASQGYARRDVEAKGGHAPHTPRKDSSDDAPDSMRLSRRMSELGLCSRREADEWIVKGWVRVDGQVISELGSKVTREQKIEIERQAKSEQARLVTILLHKPIGYVSGQAEDDYKPASVLVLPENRWEGCQSGHEFHPRQLKNLAPAGRLDIDSVGLLVLTQDGRVARQLIGADSETEKEYLVRVRYEHGERLPMEELERLRHGLELDGKPLLPARVEWQNEDQLRFVLKEGKKRQIRRMCEAVGLKVLALKRIRIGRVTLGDLPIGQWRYLREDEAF